MGKWECGMRNLKAEGGGRRRLNSEVGMRNAEFKGGGRRRLNGEVGMRNLKAEDGQVTTASNRQRAGCRIEGGKVRGV
jgi:hypothetical protein